MSHSLRRLNNPHPAKQLQNPKTHKLLLWIPLHKFQTAEAKTFLDEELIQKH